MQKMACDSKRYNVMYIHRPQWHGIFNTLCT